MKLKTTKILSLSLFFLLFLTLFLNSNTVNAYIIDNETGFEDGTLSHNYTNTWLSTYRKTSNPFYVDSTSPKTDAKDFIVYTTAGIPITTLGYWNYTYSTLQFMHQWEIYSKLGITGAGYGTGLYLHFYDINGTEIIMLYSNSNSNLYYWDYTHTQKQISTGNITSYDRWSISFLSNDSIVYHLNDNYVIGTPYNIVDNPKIVSIKFEGFGSAHDDYFLFDDHSILISDTLSGGGTTEGVFPSCSGSGISNIIETSNYIELLPHYYYVTQIYKVVSTFNITDFRVLAENLYDISYYQIVELKINSYNLGFPNNLHSYGNTILLSWENLSGVKIKGEMVYICLKFSRETTHPFDPDETKPYTFQTTPIFDMTKNDIDNDGFVYLTIHNDLNYWNNFCNNHYYRDYSINIYNGYSPIINYYDLDYAFCYEYPQNIVVHNFDNNLWVDSSTITITDNVNIGYTISIDGLGYDNYIKINKSGVDYLNTKLTSFSDAGSISFRVLDSGTYNVSLIQNSIVVKTVQFTGIGSLGNCYIYTDIAQTTTGTNFKIYYAYPYTSFEGIITYSKCGSSAKEITSIEKTSNGSITYSFSDEGYYNIFLSMRFSNNSYSQKASTSIVINNIHSNILTLSDYAVKVPKTIEVFGEHNFIGANIYIYRNGVAIIDGSVNCEGRYAKYDYIATSGTYNYTLVIRYGSITKTLDYKILIASDVSGTEPPEENVLNLIPNEVKVVIGCIITIVFCLIPLAISLSLGGYNVEIPSLVYVGMFLLGIVVSIALGFFEFWVIFFVLMALIIVLAIFWVQRKIA